MDHGAAWRVAQQGLQFRTAAADDLGTIKRIIFGETARDRLAVQILDLDDIAALELAFDGSNPGSEQAAARLQGCYRAAIDRNRTGGCQSPAQPGFAGIGAIAGLEQGPDIGQCIALQRVFFARLAIFAASSLEVIPPEPSPDEELPSAIAMIESSTVSTTPINCPLVWLSGLRS